MRTKVIPLIATVLTVAVLAWQAQNADPVLCDDPGTRLGEIPGYTSERFAPSAAELQTLPSDTRFDKRIYRAENGRIYHVSVVVGGRSKSSIHRPELCLPSQGFQMLEPRGMTVADVHWHVVTLAQGVHHKTDFAYTFFNQAGFATSSHVRRILQDIWDRSVLCRIDRWVMVTVVSPGSDDDRALAEFLTQLKEFLK